MRSLGSVVIALVWSVSPATAQVPVEVGVTAGMRWDRFRNTTDMPLDNFGTTRWGADVQLDIGYRATRALTVGLHTGFTQDTRVWHDCVMDNSASGETCRDIADRYRALPLGLVVRLDLFDHGWLAPWFGKLFSARDNQSDWEWAEWRWGYGIAAGVDVVQEQRHHLGVYASIARSEGDGTYEPAYMETHPLTRENIQISFGLAYRHR